MSRSNRVEVENNPCTRWFEWSGGKDGGYLSYYDKAAEARVRAPNGFTFLALDELACITGWSEKREERIFSNEVKGLRDRTLTVRTKSGELLSGLYADIKIKIRELGGKYAAALYCAYKDGVEYRIGKIMLTGAALSAWLDYKKQADVYDQAIKIDDFKEDKKGSVTFRTPVFKTVTPSEAASAQAMQLDKSLQDYFQSRNAPSVEPAQHLTPAVEDKPDDDPFADDDIPF